MSDTASGTPEDLTALLENFGGRGFGGTIGMEYVSASADEVAVRVPVAPPLHQPHGIVHGGVYCAIAEEVSSVAGALWLGDRGRVVGVHNSTDFLRGISEGVIHAVGRPIHRGRSQQLWRVEMSDDDGRPLALGQVRLANLS